MIILIGCIILLGLSTIMIKFSIEFLQEKEYLFFTLTGIVGVSFILGSYVGLVYGM